MPANAHEANCDRWHAFHTNGQKCIASGHQEFAIFITARVKWGKVEHDAVGFWHRGPLTNVANSCSRRLDNRVALGIEGDYGDGLPVSCMSRPAPGIGRTSLCV